jgi:site-specific DNA recombinase
VYLLWLRWASQLTRDEQIKRITALQDFIRSQPAELTEFDEVLVRRWFKQITVYEDHYTVELKSGLKVDIDAE